jgi:hypothetical protein
MSPLLLSSSRRKRPLLPPHGYEGRRAEALPLPKPPPLATRTPPSEEELAKAGISFEPVGVSPTGPLRARREGRPLGVFLNRSAAFGVMRTLGILTLLVCVLMPASNLRAAGGAEILSAIASVEDWRGRVGAAGEIGPYQMLPSTRADRLRELQAAGVNYPTERELARAHLAWIRRQLLAADVEPLPFNLALCWNAGVRATITNRAPVRSYDYARRVVALLSQP